MNLPHSVQGDCAKTMVCFIRRVFSAGISQLAQMQSLSLFLAVIHSWFVMCQGSLLAVGVPHVQSTFPSLSPRRGQGLELADKQTKGQLF